MATFNNAHHESGGVVLFNGELILLFCDNVNLSVVERNESETGRLYLTTHRMIFTNSSMKNNLKSLSIPFYTMQGLTLEQPIFGANYIKGQATEAQTNNKFTFKLKFNSGGATEYGQALLNAAKAVRQIGQSGAFQPPPPYTNSASQYYQAPPNVYQPAYNCGFSLPNDIFNQPPPAGFIYTSEMPPPYPGLNSNDQQPQGKPQQAPTGYPTQPAYAPQNYPAQGYPGQQHPPQGPPPGAGFAGFMSGPPPSSGQNGYPQQQQHQYQQQPNPYPPAAASSGQNQNSMYPSLDEVKPSAPPM